MAVIVTRVPDLLIFSLQWRAVAVSDEARLRVTSADVRVNLVFSTGILYCPWCGRDLKALVRATPAKFEELARSHQRFSQVP
jgi:hypothetical protein